MSKESPVGEHLAHIAAELTDCVLVGRNPYPFQVTEVICVVASQQQELSLSLFASIIWPPPKGKEKKNDSTVD